MIKINRRDGLLAVIICIFALRDNRQESKMIEFSSENLLFDKGYIFLIIGFNAFNAYILLLYYIQHHYLDKLRDYKLRS